LAAAHWIVTVWPALNVPEVGPVRLKVGGVAGAWMTIAWVRWEYVGLPPYIR
jgi:hypothetical protein